MSAARLIEACSVDFLFVALTYVLRSVQNRALRNLCQVEEMSREADRQKFKRLAEQRVTRVLKQIKLVGNLSNKSNYVYEDADVKKIYRAIKGALDEMKARFDKKGTSSDEQFRL